MADGVKMRFKGSYIPNSFNEYLCETFEPMSAVYVAPIEADQRISAVVKQEKIGESFLTSPRWR